METNDKVVKLNLEITIPKRWVTKFLQFLNCLRWCGQQGTSRTVAFYADGDGDFRPFDFKVNGEEVEQIKFSEYDIPVPKDTNRLLPQFKTRRAVDFFFDAG